jgi:hypothetical protein
LLRRKGKADGELGLALESGERCCDEVIVIGEAVAGEGGEKAG